MENKEPISIRAALLEKLKERPELRQKIEQWKQNKNNKRKGKKNVQPQEPIEPETNVD